MADGPSETIRKSAEFLKDAADAAADAATDAAEAAVEAAEAVLDDKVEALQESKKFIKNLADGAFERPAFLGSDKEMAHLLSIIGDALQFFPPLYADSILGHPWTWLPPHDYYSEFNIVNPVDFMQSFRYLYEVAVPSPPTSPPKWARETNWEHVWRPTQVLFQADPDDNPYSFPDEAWIYINGIATNHDMARLNARFIAKMFHRPMTIIQNATNSVLLDLAEAAIGKAWQVTTEASAVAYPFIREALSNEEKERVVVLCHSQGTIVMSNVLRALVNPEVLDMMADAAKELEDGELVAELKPLQDARLLDKLEIYTFANCADVMEYVPLAGDRKPTPLIENFGNEYDLVARLGALAPNPEKRDIRIDGPLFKKEGGWGHCLNLHYLMGIRDHLENPGSVPDPYPGAAGGPSRSRLYEYWAGGSPKNA